MIRAIEMHEYDEKNRLVSSTIPNPSWERFLDGFDTTQRRERAFAGITVTAQDGSFLLIDGSDGLFFALYERADGFQFQSLANPLQLDEEVTIICGGVATTLPRAYLLEEAAALRVVWDFWQGQLDTTVGWEPL